MKIDANYSGLTLAQGRGNGTIDAVAFAAAMAQAQAAPADAGAATDKQSRQQSAEQRAAEVRQANAALRQALQDFLDKPLAVHLREAVMEEMGLSEEKLAAMTPDELQAVEAEINRRIRERLLGTKEDGAQQAMDAVEPSGGGAQPAAAAAIFNSSPALDALIAQIAAAAKR